LLEIQRDEITVSERLCIGSFAVVYEGQWRCSHIALKVLRCISGGSAFDSLEAELDLLSQLRHPRILTLMGVCTNLGRPEGNVALVMEHMEQGSLYNILHDSEELLPCSTSNYMKRIRLAVDIADGMRFLHHSGVVHKDLRSGHVLVGSDGRAKISDFGLGRYNEIALRTTDPRVLLARTTAFPAAWSAPELIRGDAGITHAIDSFSFGVIIWELLTGEVPWKSMSLQQITAAVGYGKRLTLSAKTAADFPDIYNVMARCFLEAKQRPTFSDLYNELSLFLTEIIKLQEAKTKKFVPDTFICCIGYEIMHDPVICADGHSYERENIELWLKQSNHSPRTNLLLAHKVLIPNYALKELIEDAKLR
jgi:serine/threonine protein kinase